VVGGGGGGSVQVRCAQKAGSARVIRAIRIR